MSARKYPNSWGWTSHDFISMDLVRVPSNITLQLRPISPIASVDPTSTSQEILVEHLRHRVAIGRWARWVPPERETRLSRAPRALLFSSWGCIRGPGDSIKLFITLSSPSRHCHQMVSCHRSSLVIGWHNIIVFIEFVVIFGILAVAHRTFSLAVEMDTTRCLSKNSPHARYSLYLDPTSQVFPGDNRCPEITCKGPNATCWKVLVQKSYKSHLCGDSFFA